MWLLKIMSKQQIVFVFLCVLLYLPCRTFAQDIEPRRWTPMPLGTHVIGAGYGNVNGKIYFDPLLEAEDVSINVNAFVVSYVQPFKLGNKLARIDVVVPYSLARWDGLLSGNPKTIQREGFSDPWVRLSLNLKGPNAMNGKEMLEYMKSHPVNTLFGVSVSVSLPFGQYDDDRLLNLGSNRFTIRPQIGMVHNWGNWSYELTSSVFFYTNNNDFIFDQVRKQAPLFAIQTHLIRRFENRMWCSLSAGYGIGGHSTVSGNSNDDERNDFLGSMSFGMPLTKFQAIKLTYIRTFTLNDIGADTNSIALGWSHLF